MIPEKPLHIAEDHDEALQLWRGLLDISKQRSDLPALTKNIWWSLAQEQNKSDQIV